MQSHFRNLVAGIALLASVASSCVAATGPFPHAPAWVADRTLYEVNLRQFSPEGNVTGFTRQLPRMQELGVGILWFMPIQPIGVKGHSGTLGSPYAVRDYTAFNPELGTLDQFRDAVDRAHRLGMFVIIDWVADHTALDHPWVAQHPDWYKHDAGGGFVHPVPAWPDVYALNYASADLRKAMIDAMSFWVRETGIDGFRCDTAEFIPIDFWSHARDVLRGIKPVFMLAEGNDPGLLNDAFDSAYAWYLPPNTEGIASGSKSVADLTNFFKAEATILPGDGFRLNYTSNHDKNADQGTTAELLGPGADSFTVLTFTVPGMPLIFNGQETGTEKRSHLFEHDPIDWTHQDRAGIYRKLSLLKRNNRALWSGLQPGAMRLFPADKDLPSMFAFERDGHGDRVVVALNLGPHGVQFKLPESAKMMNLVMTDDATPAAGETLEFKPWGYRVWSNLPAN